MYRELGLKISAEKFKAMKFKAASPGCHLRVQGDRLYWVRFYQYLREWVDSGVVIFLTRVTYLRDRTIHIPT